MIKLIVLLVRFIILGYTILSPQKKRIVTTIKAPISHTLALVLLHEAGWISDIDVLSVQVPKYQGLGFRFLG